jgi:hypothetical protein
MKTVALTQEMIDRIFEPTLAVSGPSDIGKILNRPMRFGAAWYTVGLVTRDLARFLEFDLQSLFIMQAAFDSKKSIGGWRVIQHNLTEYEVWEWIKAKGRDLKILSLQPQTQEAVLIALYRTVLPDWDRIEKLNGWPSCNKNTWKYIAKRFMEFDSHHHPECVAGGAWMNTGFSTLAGDELPDWKVMPCEYTLAPQREAVYA